MFMLLVSWWIAFIGSNIDDEGYDRIPKSQVLVYRPAVSAVLILASIRKP